MIFIARLRQLEQWMIYVRWFGVAFGAVALTIQPGYPDEATEITAWAILGFLALGNLVIWGAIARIPAEGDHSKLSFGSFLLDSIVIMGFVWVYAFEDPYVTWALLFLIPMEGALRYRLTGALLAALAVALFFIPQSFRRADFVGGGFDVPTFVSVVGFATLVAGITGAMANSWHQQSLALRRQSLQLAELDKLKDRFLAITSHEIRGPLTAILGGIETIRQRGNRLSPQQRKSMEEIVANQAQQLARLVDDLLVTSQLQAGKLALAPQMVDLEDVIKQALDAAASLRRDHLLELFIEPVRCEIDADRVTQIVRNLVENAFKYTPRRTRVAITSRATNNGIQIEVADEGPGIPAESKDSLFEAFSRISQTAAGRAGMGLGLHVVSQLVVAMEGRIDLNSSSRGTTFSIFIPAPVESQPTRRLGIVAGDE
ncbi:MAG: HAMP domain-containing histidine kinase [Actinomycetota bacterium]|nr:HAMP domain-containing histidine kinase [Actinomycetota bacterium]